jgi:hypothetical protein
MPNISLPLLLFDRVNIARCAMERAQQHLHVRERFDGEYATVRLWVRKQCVYG